MHRTKGEVFICTNCNTLSNATYFVMYSPFYDKRATPYAGSVTSVKLVVSIPPRSTGSGIYKYKELSLSSAVYKELIITFNDKVLTSNIISLEQSNNMYYCIHCNSLIHNMWGSYTNTPFNKNRTVTLLDYDMFPKLFNFKNKAYHITSVKQLQQIHKENFLVDLTTLTTEHLVELKKSLTLKQ